MLIIGQNTGQRGVDRRRVIQMSPPYVHVIRLRRRQRACSVPATIGAPHQLRSALQPVTNSE